MLGLFSCVSENAFVPRLLYCPASRIAGELGDAGINGERPVEGGRKYDGCRRREMRTFAMQMSCRADRPFLQRGLRGFRGASQRPMPLSASRVYRDGRRVSGRRRRIGRNSYGRSRGVIHPGVCVMSDAPI